MTPFGNGTPDRRKPGDHPKVGGSRDDDPELDVAKRWTFWVKFLVFHRGKLTALATALAAIAGYTVAAYGLGRRVDKVEALATSTEKRVSRLEQSDPIKLYLLCTLVRRIDPPAEPPECK